MSDSPTPMPPGGGRVGPTIVSYQQLKGLRSTSHGGPAAEQQSSHRSTPQPSDGPPAWAVPVVRQVLSPAAHLLPHQQRSGESPDRTPDHSRVSILERELESRRTAMARMESENLSLLRDLTQWKLAEEDRMKKMSQQHREETDELRGNLNRLVQEMERQSEAANNSPSRTASAKDRHALILLQQKIDMRDAEIKSLTQKVISLEQQHIIHHNGDPAANVRSSDALVGRIEGLESLLRQKESEMQAEGTMAQNLKKQVHEKSVECTRQKRELAARDASIVELKEELDSLRRAAENHNRQMDEMQSRVRVLAEELTVRETQTLELQLSSKGEIERVTESARGQSRELEQTKQLLLKMEGAAHVSRQELEDMRAQLASAQEASSRAEALSKRHALDVEDLQTTIDDLKIALQDSQSRLHVCQGENEELKRCTEMAKGSLEVHRDENVRKVESLTLKLKTVEEQVDTLKSSNARLVREVQMERDHATTLQQRVDEGASKVAEQRSLLTEIDELAFDISKKQQLIAHHHEQHQDTIRRIAQLERALEQSQDAQAVLAVESETLRQQVSAQTVEIQHWCDRASTCEVLESRIGQMESELRAKHEELQVLTVAYEELRHHCSTLQHQVSDMERLEEAMQKLARERQEALQQFEHAQVTLLSEREALARLSSSHELTLKKLRSAEDERAVTAAELSAARGLAVKLNEANRVIEARSADIESLRVDVHRVEITNETLQHEKQALSKQNQAAEIAQATLRNEIHLLQVQLAETQTSLGRMEVRDNDLMKRNERLVEQHEVDEASIQDLQSRLNTMEDSCKGLNISLAEAHHRVQELQERHATLESEKSAVDVQLDEARGLLQSTSLRYATAEEHSAALEQRLGHQAALEAKIKAQQNIIEAKTREVDALQREGMTLREKASSAEAAASVRRTLEETVDKARHAFEQSDSERLRLASQNEILERRIAHLEDDGRSKDKESKRLHDCISHEKSRYDALMGELQVLERKVKSKATLDGKFEAVQGICDQQREELSKLRQQLAELQDRDTEDRHAQDQVRTLSFEVRQLRVQLDAKECAVRELEEDIEKKVGAVQRLRRDMQEKDTQFAQAQEQLQEAKRDAARLQRELEALQSDAKAHRASSIETSHVRQRDADVAAVTRSEFEESLRASDARCASIQNKCQQQDELIAQLRAQLRETEVSKAKIDMDLDILRGSLRECKDALERAHNDASSLRQECAQQSALVRDKEKTMVHLQQVHTRELQSRDDDITALAAMIDDVKKHAASKSQSNRSADTDLEAVRIELRLVEDSNDQLRAEISALHEEVRHLRSGYPSATSSPPPLHRGRHPSVTGPTTDVSDQLRADLEDEQRRHRALQQQHDELLRSVDSVKRAFAQRESALEGDLREANRKLNLLAEESKSAVQRRQRH